MSHYDWPALKKQFLKAHRDTAIGPSQWLDKKGIPRSTGRRYINTKLIEAASDQVSDAAKKVASKLEDSVKAKNASKSTGKNKSKASSKKANTHEVAEKGEDSVQSVDVVHSVSLERKAGAPEGNTNRLTGGAFSQQFTKALLIEAEELFETNSVNTEIKMAEAVALQLFKLYTASLEAMTNNNLEDSMTLIEVQLGKTQMGKVVQEKWSSKEVFNQFQAALAQVATLKHKRLNMDKLNAEIERLQNINGLKGNDLFSELMSSIMGISATKPREGLLSQYEHEE